MEKLVIKYPQELKQSLIDVDFSLLIKEIQIIMDKRNVLENVLRKEQIDLLKEINDLLLTGEITSQEASDRLDIPEETLIQSIHIIRTSTVNEIHFSSNKPFVLYENDYLEWFIKLDYNLIAIEETEKFMNKFNNFLE